MNKREFAAKVADVLRESGVRKPVSIPKRSFTVTDEDGKSCSFNVKSQDKNVQYTAADIKCFLDACTIVVENALREGEEINIIGMGKLIVHRRAARKTKQPGTDNWVEVPERYVPKYYYSKNFRMAALAYDMNLSEEQRHAELIPHVDEYDDEEGLY